jgi:hypothetical protein
MTDWRMATADSSVKQNWQWPKESTKKNSGEREEGSWQTGDPNFWWTSASTTRPGLRLRPGSSMAEEDQGWRTPRRITAKSTISPSRLVARHFTYLPMPISSFLDATYISHMGVTHGHSTDQDSGDLMISDAHESTVTNLQISQRFLLLPWAAY